MAQPVVDVSGAGCLGPRLRIIVRGLRWLLQVRALTAVGCRVPGRAKAC